MDDLITVIIPIYNLGNYMKRCVDSILAQTYKSIEIILVNDGSTDNSGKLCDQFANTDERIKVIHQKNGGLSNARNSGLRCASGKYVTFLDADDYVDNDYIEAMHELAVKNNADIILSDGIFERNYLECKYENLFLQNEVKVLTAKEAFKVCLEHKGLRGSPWTAWGKLFDIALFHGVFFPDGHLSEDLAVIPILMSKAQTIVYMPEKKYHYELRGNSIISNASEKLLCDNYLYIGTLKALIEEKYQSLKKLAYIEYVWVCIQLFLMKNCRLDNIYSPLRKDLIKYGWYFIIANRKIKYKILLLCEILFPQLTRRSFWRKKGGQE